MLRNDVVARWSGHEAALVGDPDAATELNAAYDADDRRTAPVDAGQGVGMVTGVETVGEVIERLCAAPGSCLSDGVRPRAGSACR